MNEFFLSRMMHVQKSLVLKQYLYRKKVIETFSQMNKACWTQYSSPLASAG